MVDVDRVERVRAVAPVLRDRPRADAVDLRVRVPPVAHGQELRRRDVDRALHREEVLAVRRQVGAVLVGEHPQGVHRGERVLLRALERGEEVRAVLDDRPAEGPAVLVPAVVLLVDVGQLLRLGPGVHRVIAERREEAALEIVRAALRHDVHHAAVAAAVLGLVALGDEVEFLDGLEREQLQEPADRVVVVVAAVNLVVDVAAVAAGNLGRLLRALGRVRVEPHRDAGNRHRQVRELPAVERQRLDLVHVDHAAHRRRGGFEQRRLARHRHRLRHRRDRELDVEVQRLGDVEHQVLALQFGEPGELQREVGLADGQRGEAEQPFTVSDDRPAEAGDGLRRRDRDSRERPALLVGDASGDVPRGLRERRHGEDSAQYERRAKRTDTYASGCLLPWGT